VRALPITIICLIATLGAACYERRTEQLPMVTVGDEIAAMGRLQAIGVAEQTYSVTGDGAYATMEQLLDRGLIADPSQGKLSVYKFDVRVTEHGFQATAVPAKYGITGKRSFYLDESRIMRGADKGGAAAGPADPPLQ
jgi:hypothetical protein